MFKKTVFLMSLILVVGFVGNVYGITTTWLGDDPNAVDRDWFKAAHWDSGVPGSTDWADIYEYAYTFPDITSGTAETGTLRINSGSTGDPSLATVTVSGGNLDCHSEIYIGYGTSGKDGELIVNSGSVRTGISTGSDWLMVGADQSFGYLTINGGTVETEWVGIPRWFTFPSGLPLAGGLVTLNGGELRVGSGFMLDYNGDAETVLIDIAGGTLIWDGNHVGEIENMQAADQITGHNFHVGLIIDYDNVNPGKTTVIAEPYNPELPSSPQPVNGGAVPGLERQIATLTWEAGIYADPNAHEVYFSDNFNDANDLNPAAMTVRNAPNFDPGPLTLGQTYYWRVVEVDAPDSWVGDVWEFTVDNFISIEDFETPIDPNNIFIDVEWITDANSLDVEMIVVRGGDQSMKLTYDGGAASGMTGTFAEPQDWTLENITALALYFHGNEGNTGSLSVSVEDDDGDVSPAVSYPDSSDLGLLTWSEFNIDLAQFNVGNVDLNKIKKINITLSGASVLGSIYIDNIGVYISRCVPDNALADFTGDCETDIDDIVFMADRWLLRGYDVTPFAPSVGPRVWYKFDGDLLDSSGNGYSGSVTSGPAIWEPSGCQDGGCINFNGDYVVIADSSAFTTLNPNDAMTFSLWLKGDGNYLPVPTDGGSYYGIMLHAASSDWEAATEALRVTCPQTTVDGSHQVAFFTRPAVDDGPNLDAVNFEANNPADWSDQWVHYAFVKDTPNSAMRIYRNGELMSENIDAGLPMGFDRDPANFKFAIGGARANATTTSYRGQIDDFRLYDYALSPAEVLYLAGAGSFTQNLWEPHTVADISGDEKISLPDFALLAAAWLDEVLWP